MTLSLCAIALPLCKARSVDLAAVRTLRVRYSVDIVHGPEFTVTVEDSRGKQSIESYTVGLASACTGVALHAHEPRVA